MKQYIEECLGFVHGSSKYNYMMELYSQVVQDYNFDPELEYDCILDKICEIESYMSS